MILFYRFAIKAWIGTNFEEYKHREYNIILVNKNKLDFMKDAGNTGMN